MAVQQATMSGPGKLADLPNIAQVSVMGVSEYLDTGADAGRASAPRCDLACPCHSSSSSLEPQH